MFPSTLAIVEPACADPKVGGGKGPDHPPEISQSYRFLSNTGPDPLKNHKLPSQHSMLGHHWPAREPHFNGVRWRFDDGPLLMVFGSLDPLPLSTKTKQNVRVGSPLTKFSRYAHDGQYVHIQTQNAPSKNVLCTLPTRYSGYLVIPLVIQE